MSLQIVGLAAVLLIAPALVHAQSAAVRVTRAAAVLQAPEGTASNVGTANPGDVLEVLDERAGWYLVRPPAGSAEPWKTGWINAASVAPVGAAVTPPVPSPPSANVESPGRKGFIIGFGGGIGLHRDPVPEVTFRGVTFGGTTSEVGVATDVKIGYAPTDHVLVYYANSAIFSSNASYDVVALTGGGVTYVHGRRAPTWFVNGAVGAATGAALDFGAGSVDSVEHGGAFSVGGGYEFARHWFLDGSAMFLTVDNRRHTVIKATINWLFY